MAWTEAPRCRCKHLCVATLGIQSDVTATGSATLRRMRFRGLVAAGLVFVLGCSDPGNQVIKVTETGGTKTGSHRMVKVSDLRWSKVGASWVGTDGRALRVTPADEAGYRLVEEHAKSAGVR
jgi:hypothetical protein